MANKPCSALFFLLQNLVPLLVLSANTFSRSEFPLPPDFVFGSGTSAYQSEGKKFKEGRTPSIWETFAHSGNVHGATGDVVCDGYHKYKVINTRKMSNSGWKPAYRFSISWSRLIPDGRGHVNPKGVEYYNHHINELIKHDEYGWLSRQFVKDFTAYADVCFREFGGTVLHWTTLNEANVFSIYRHHHILLAHASAAKLHRKTYQVFAVGCGFFAATYNLS